jgi:NADH dehydrogenase
MARRLVTVFGGSGFIGRHLVQRLAADGWTVRVAVRDTEAASFLQPLGNVGQIVAVPADITHAASVELAMRGADAVVNLVGILYERGKASFEAIHVKGARTVAEAAARAGVAKLVHMSALGADKASESAYARSKAQGEDAVRAAFPAATILRPSVVFGPEDDFFNRFAVMLRSFGVLPVITADGFKIVRRGGTVSVDLYGGGGPKFQPVYVGDVAEAVMVALRSDAAAGQTYELGGPEVLSMKQIHEMVMKTTERCGLLAPLPFPLARLQAAFLQWWPKPMLTPDQVTLLKKDNVLTGKPGFDQLGITPTAPDVIVPTYLVRYKPVEKLWRNPKG